MLTTAKYVVLRAFIAVSILISIVVPTSVLAQVSFEVDKFELDGESPIGLEETQQILQEFLGAHEGIEKLRSAASALETAIQDQGFSFHRVNLPPQVLDSGTVILEIRKIVVGEISVSGNKHFSDNNIKRSLPQLQSGETPNTRALSRALAVANFNSAKRTRLTFGRGEGENTLDARIDVADREPQQTYLWLNNTGSDVTTRTRAGLGYQHRNLFDRSHVVTATATISPEDLDRVDQFGLNYQAPVSLLTGTVSIYYADSNVDTGRVAEVLDVAARGRTLGVRYSQVLNKIGKVRQRAYIDVVDKLFDNDVDFAGNEIGVDVRSRPVSLNWQLEKDQGGNDFRFNIALAQNLSGGNFNDDAAYAASRSGASSDWQAIRFNYSQGITLPRNWRLNWNILGQYTDEPLIAGEQLGLGGSLGPRGFEEREAGIDRGVNARLQLWGPALSNGFQLGGFIDHGFGENLNLPDDQEADRDLTSIGLSGKWQWANRLILNVDAGHVLDGLEHEPTLTQEGDNRVHFNLLYRLSGG